MTPPPDWKVAHAKTLKDLSEAMSKALYGTSFYGRMYTKYTRPGIRYTIVLEWRGWKLIEVIEDVALGHEFYRVLPNGRRGLFGNAEEFTTTAGEKGYLYHCICED